MYHTQENRGVILSEPVECFRDDAWLGNGYYYWLNKDDAEMWGNKSKKATGKYDIYRSIINCENVLDTVFNEAHYNFWLKKIELVAKKIAKETMEKPTLKELNSYFKERGAWEDVTGIMFQDLPESQYHSLVKPIAYNNKNTYFAYRKRIQLAVFNKKVIRSFAHFNTGDCF